MSSTNVGEVLFDYYLTRGLEFALDLASKIMVAEEAKSMASLEDRNQVSGALCEAVLELCLLEYCKLNPDKTKDWFYSKGLVIKDIDNPDSDFLTEIDFLLITNSTIVVFECKAYKGEKEIIKNGTIRRKGFKDFDVFSQQALHIETFAKMFNGFRYERAVGLKQCYRAAAFLFASGATNDTRPVEVQRVMPFLEPNTLTNFLQSISESNNWQLNYVRKAVELIEKDNENLRRKHLSYVKSLHGGKSNKRV